MMVDLAAEFASAMNDTTDAHRTSLLAAGLFRHQLVRWPLCGIAKVVVERGLYEPRPDGKTAVITPVRIDAPLTPETSRPEVTVRFGAIVDLVCWHPRRPLAWATRLGTASWLGAIEPQFADPAPVRVHRSPLHWLRARAVGLVPLDLAPRVAAPILLTCRHLIAEDETHRQALHRLLREPYAMPRISIAASPHSRRAA